MISKRFFMHFLILMLSAIFVSFSASLSSVEENDRMSLLALKDGFTLSGTPTDGSSLNSWNSSLNICDWKGVRCGSRHKRVTAVRLVEQKLNGVLSPWIGNLTFLRELHLGNNSLYGEIPKQIGNLRGLQYLNLQLNSFVGRIPVELSNCSNLMQMYLSGNNLIGLIPFQLGLLSKMTVFFVGQNFLVGEMPTFFRNFSSLTGLHLGINNFHGEIGDKLQGLSKLSLLSLPINNFTGTIAPLYNLSSLMVLELLQNNFTGTLAPYIDAAFPKLTWLSIAYNGFTGPIPPTVFNISGLTLIIMHVNDFTGSVPNNIGSLKDLHTFSIALNNLGGSVKSNDLRFFHSLSNCTKLKRLDVAGNKFRGPLPNSLANFSDDLKILGINDNYITGRIPGWVGGLTGLTLLNFGRNMLMGRIPNSIGKLSNLSKLYLAGNKLVGEIPVSIGKLTNLYMLDLSGNSLEGIIPQSLGNCESMQSIDISGNNFGGYLPGDAFGQFKNLKSCNLSRNSLGGEFPLQLSSLITLSSLDVSYNNFIGEIPAQLSESLEFLSMAGNSFQGDVPSSLGSLRGLSWLDLSSNKLSGPVTKELASLVFLQHLNLSFNQLEGEFPLLKNVTGVSVLGNNKLCGGNPELQLLPCSIEKKTKSISVKVIIAVMVGTVAVLFLLVLLFIFFFRRRKDETEDVDGLDERYRRITYAELFKATNGFAESNLIGTGSFGDVYKGNLDESELVAVKVLKLSKHGATKSFIAECKVLSSIRHRNLLRIKTSCSSLDHKGNDFKALVFKYMSNGNLDSWLHINQHQEVKTPLTFAKRIQIALDVASALNYLHTCCEPPVVHCDLKPSNILLDDDMVAHVGDFGLAKLLYGVKENISGGESLSAAIRGTVGYVAPEYGMGATISLQGDLYSYGVLLLELITGKRSTNGMFSNEMNLLSYIESAIPDHIEEVVDECLVNEFNEAAATQTNSKQYKLQWRTSLLSFVEVGLCCSVKSPKERMDMQAVINCLMKIKENVR